MKPIAIAAIVGLLGCEPADIVPNTAAGFRDGGVLGAVGGASRAILASCRMLDGRTVQVAVDGMAAVAGAGGTIEGIRAARQNACIAAGAVQAIGGGFAPDTMAPTVHGRGDAGAAAE